MLLRVNEEGCVGGRKKRELGVVRWITFSAKRYFQISIR
jgi:hypothetical protein